VGVFRMVDRHVDRAGAEIGEVEARVVDARDTLVLGEPAGKGRDLGKIELCYL
jgi:hypothetical protein